MLICLNEMVSNCVIWWFEFKCPLYYFEWYENEYWIDWSDLIIYCWILSYFGVCWMKNDMEWMKLLIYVSILWLSSWKCCFLLFYRLQGIVHLIRFYLSTITPIWIFSSLSNADFSIWRVLVVFTISNWKKYNCNYFDILIQ